jgi:phosphate transport system substrate-binding protein
LRYSTRFKELVGTGTSIKWPIGIGAKGDTGVANVTAQTPGAIGYVEHAYAKKNGSTYVKLVNADGGVVTPTLAAFTSAAEHTDWKIAPSNYATLVNRPGADTWPITRASYILMYERPEDPTEAAQALKFFEWAYKDGNGMAYALDYATLPDNAKEAAIKAWKRVVAADGTPVLEIPTSK